MDEAEYLCDRIGIFVDGNFQCLGTTDEVTVMILPASLQFNFLELDRHIWGLYLFSELLEEGIILD